MASPNDIPAEPAPGTDDARVCPSCHMLHTDTADACTEVGEVLGLTGGGEAGPGVGQVLGSYQIVEPIGQGGMGRVFRANHTRLGRIVALKVLRPDLAGNPRVTSRFFSEARAVNQINHENIIQITDFFDDGPEKYYVMELLEGESLQAVLRRHGVLPLRRLLQIAVQVCDALAAVHRAGMVHRDLKPENVFLTERAGRKDFVKLLDFGVVKLGNLELVGALSNTGDGAIIGTPEYMSPEQVSSDPVDHRTDIYALGVILFQAVTGRRPFAANSFGEIVVQHLTVKPPRPSALQHAEQPIPPRLESLILRCLAKDREDRPQSMEEIGRQLGEMLADVTATEIRMTRRRSLRFAFIAASLLVAGGGALAVRQLLSPPDAAAIPPPVDAHSRELARVQITFESSPPGAAVANGEQALGVTPLTVTLDKADTAREFRFSLAGYEPATQQVSLQANGLVLVQLAAAEPGPPPNQNARRKARAGRQKKKSAARRGTLDPF